MKGNPSPQDKETCQALAEATRDLLYMSETDAPFEVVSEPGTDEPLDEKKLRALAGRKGNEPVATESLDDFFAGLIEEQEWHGAEERETARRYGELLRTIEKHMAEARVWRVGKINVEIFILGRTRSGGWAGVRTRAVET